MRAECHPTTGFAVRTGWHCTPVPEAPHLGTNGRRWYRVEIRGIETFLRPACQGGRWLLARYMRVLEPLSDTKTKPDTAP
jgi:hypothetical protein